MEEIKPSMGTSWMGAVGTQRLYQVECDLGQVTHPTSISRVVPVSLSTKKNLQGVPVVAQWLTNPTRNHEITGLIPGLAQWFKDLALQ